MADAKYSLGGVLGDAKDKVASALGADSPATETGGLRNRAGESRSPYVRAHKNNPVAWQLWGDEAISLAKKQNKLIFVSIGYSACHWCHVMERESFENTEVAQILNNDFIPIKVDREERPDIDRIYMNFVQATTGSGGWPLNVFLTPTLEPVFGGTYFPGPNFANTQTITGQEQIGFVGILDKLASAWEEQEDRCRQDAASILQQLKDFAAEGTFGSRMGLGLSSLEIDLLEEAYTHYSRTFDTVHGGFGSAPKFPTPAKLAFLLRLQHYPQAVIDVIGEEEVRTAKTMAVTTLRAMARGGIHDQIGHGFARYSVTADWSLPHFEKMLYDNAQLLAIYLDAFLSSSDPEILGVVYDLAAYLTEDLAAHNGGFYSSEDADSFYRKGDTEKREGAFYVWTRREFEEILGSHAASICAAFWGVQEHGNVDSENDAHDELLNKNVLAIKTTPKILASQIGVSEEDVVKVIKESKEKLLKHRNTERVRPSLDDKIVLGWNGIAIGSLARTSRVIESFDPGNSKKCMDAARKAAFFIRKDMYNESSKTLKRVWREGTGETQAFADDYAFFIEGLIDLYEATAEQEWLEWADTLQKTQLELFFDSSSGVQTPGRASGGFFATPFDAPNIILRLKDGMDTSEPSTNGVSACNLYRLSSLLEDTKYASFAAQTINAFESETLQYPHLFGSFMPAIVASVLGLRSTITVLPEGCAINGATLGPVAPRGGLETVHTLITGNAEDVVKKSWVRSRNEILKILPQPKGEKPVVLICEDGVCKEVNDGVEGVVEGVQGLQVRASSEAASVSANVSAV